MVTFVRFCSFFYIRHHHDCRLSLRLIYSLWFEFHASVKLSLYRRDHDLVRVP
jgi:hypothetical protein